MELILILLVVLLILKPSSHGSFGARGKSNNSFKKEEDDIDPDDTFHREDGLDHETDEDGYCEECDDYHNE